MNSPSPSGYALVDFGLGRKLERFGDRLVDRPAPAALGPRSDPKAWLSADLIFQPEPSKTPPTGIWFWKNQPFVDPSSIPAWTCPHAGLLFHVRPQRSGQLGLFPEHWRIWPWLQGWLRDRSGRLGTETMPHPTVLHLFAYTGATTLALASFGMVVTHVDAMESAVAWGRENARLSQLENCPIRWIVDDARAFVAREVRRGRRYDLILMDPPSYGHGSRGQAWEIHRDLIPLARTCWSLLSQDAGGLILTGHSPDIDLQSIRTALAADALPYPRVGLKIESSILRDQANRAFSCGYVARFFPERLAER